MVEAAAVLRRWEIGGHLTQEQASAALARLLTWPGQRYPLAPLLNEAWTYRHNLVVAEALYMVLALRLGADLLTDDHKLAGSPTLPPGVKILTLPGHAIAARPSSPAWARGTTGPDDELADLGTSDRRSRSSSTSSAAVAHCPVPEGVRAHHVGQGAGRVRSGRQGPHLLARSAAKAPRRVRRRKIGWPTNKHANGERLPRSAFVRRRSPSSCSASRICASSSCPDFGVTRRWSLATLLHPVRREPLQDLDEAPLEGAEPHGQQPTPLLVVLGGPARGRCPSIDG